MSLSRAVGSETWTRISWTAEVEVELVGPFRPRPTKAGLIGTDSHITITVRTSRIGETRRAARERIPFADRGWGTSGIAQLGLAIRRRIGPTCHRS
jgi:hypothetical protein